MYSSTVLDHFGNPRNIGRPNETTAIGLSGVPDAGPFMRIFLAIENSFILKSGFETYGCVASIAAGSVMTTWLVGKSVGEARSLTQKQLVDMLGGLPLGKEHCAGTAVSALASALERSSDDGH
jgi:nitrogen fixation protein NifU and related proteins